MRNSMAGLGKIEVVVKPLEPAVTSKPIDNKPIELKPSTVDKKDKPPTKTFGGIRG